MIGISFDVEPDLHTNKYEGIIIGLAKIKKLLDKYNIKATFFITCDCIEKYPEIFLALKREGHELALHGYNHIRLDSLTGKEKEKQIKKAIACFKKYKLKPEGFRAVQHSIDSETLNLLEKYGFKYDSSCTPFNFLQLIFFPKKKQSYLQFFSPLNKYKIRKNLYELPISSFLMPFVSLVFRAFPKFLIKIYFYLLKIFYKNQILYMHSWDFIDTGGRIAKTFPKEKLINNLNSFLKYSTKGNKFCRLIDLV